MEVSNSLPVTPQASGPSQQLPGQDVTQQNNPTAEPVEARQEPESTSQPSSLETTEGERPDSAALQAAGERVGTLLDVQA